MNRRSSQSGSAFFIILVAIAMFAAFSYTVFQGGTKSQSQLTDEQARMAATDIIAYGDTLAKTVQALKLRGCADTQFDFENTQWKLADGSLVFGPGSNSNAVSGCKVFSVSDGGAIAINLPVPYFNDLAQTPGQVLKGSGYIMANGFPQIGSSAMDMGYMLPHLRTEICLKINDILGVYNPFSLPPNITFTNVKYVGDYTQYIQNITDTDSQITGKSAFCATAGNNRFFRVLIAR